MICLYVAVSSEMLDESIVGDLTSLGKTVHVFMDLDDNMSVVDERLEQVLLHDAGRNFFDGDSHAFVIVHGSVRIKVFDADRRAFCIRSGQDAVKRHFDVLVSAQGVPTSHGYWLRLLPTVKWMRLVSASSGRTLAPIRR